MAKLNKPKIKKLRCNVYYRTAQEDTANPASSIIYLVQQDAIVEALEAGSDYHVVSCRKNGDIIDEVWHNWTGYWTGY